MAQTSQSDTFSGSTTNETIRVLQADSGAPITVPGDAWLLKADFAPQGPDLLLTGPDGNDQLLFVIDDSTAANDVSVWHWNDASGNADGVVDAAEITDLATVDNIDISTLIAGNFG